MRVLVAGGAGFVGSHLCEALLKRGHEVLAVDNLITGRLVNLESFQDHPNFQFMEHDVCEPLDVEVDAVFHLASPASPVSYGKYPLATLRVNSIGTENLLELARVNGASFLFTSTSEIYGNALVHPQPEEYWGNVNPVGPRSCYDEAKRYAEALIVNFGRLTGLDYRITRLFNVYGPRNDPNDGRVIPNFVTNAIRGEPMTVYGDGAQTRSLCYIDDIVKGLMLLMWTPGARGEIVNLGMERETSMLRLAELIRTLAESDSEILLWPARDEEIERRRPSIAKAREVLGWEPVVSLEEGLRQTIAWYRTALDDSTLDADVPPTWLREPDLTPGR